nr:MAG TPA: hypothetical protein [Caudoviricetes sp.]
MIRLRISVFNMFYSQYSSLILTFYLLYITLATLGIYVS